jgi:hypothetical protein
MRFLFLILLASFSIKAQLKLSDSLSFPYEHVKLNAIGSVFAFNEDSVVLLDSSFSYKFTFDYSSLGSIESLSSNVSLKTLLFDKNNQSLYFLDNSLSLQNQKNIPSSFVWVDQIEWLSNGNFVIYNNENHLLICDATFTVIYDSGNLENLLGLKYEGLQLHVDKDQILLCGKEQQLELDMNGALISNLRYTVNQSFAYSQGALLYKQDGSVVVRDLSSNQVLFDIKRRNVSDLQVFDGKIYLLSQNMLYIYNIQ